MAVSYSCDGCSQPVVNPAKSGHILKREYCEKCAELANEFLKHEEELRKAMHEKFIDDRALLIARYSAGNFKLPDVA